MAASHECSANANTAIAAISIRGTTTHVELHGSQKTSRPMGPGKARSLGGDNTPGDATASQGTTRWVVNGHHNKYR